MHAESTPYRDTTADEQTAQRRIMIVEDNRSIAQAMQFLLKREGYATKWCDDQSVYDQIREWKPDLILMDLKMPQLDGGEVTARIKSDPDTATIPVIVVTANPVSPERVRQMQANDLINKPFQVRRLLDRIHYWLDRRRAGAVSRPRRNAVGTATVIRRNPGTTDGIHPAG